MQRTKLCHVTISLQPPDVRASPDTFHFELLRYNFLKLLHEEMYFSIVGTLTETGKLEEICVHMLNCDPTVVFCLKAFSS